MKRLCLGIFPILLLLVFCSDAYAQFRIGPHTGLNFDGTDLFLGGSAQFDLTLGEHTLIGNPGLDVYLFIDNVTVTRINADLLYPLSRSALQAYVGTGVLVQFTSFDLPENAPQGVEDSDVDLGLNLKVGTIFAGGDSSWKPFVETTLSVGNGTDLAARAGIYLTL